MVKKNVMAFEYCIVKFGGGGGGGWGGGVYEKIFKKNIYTYLHKCITSFVGFKNYLIFFSNLKAAEKKKCITTL